MNNLNKILLTLIITLISVPILYAQNNNDVVYIVFTSNSEDEDTKGVNVYIDEDDDYNMELYRSPGIAYEIFSRPVNYFYKFIYLNWNDRENNPIVSKPESFLNTIEYIDWDIIGNSLTKQQAEQMYQEIISHSKIYFIDRNETENGTIKMVPVKVMKSAY